MGEIIPLTQPAPGGVVCPRCQAGAGPDTNFCPRCGHDLRGRSSDSDTFRGFLPGKVIDGRYKLLERLGEGGMGTVFKVEHVRMGKVLALKMLRPDLALDGPALERFRTEARVVSRLSHPNTISVFDFGELDEGGLYIAMEYVQGQDLARTLARDGRLPERRAAQVGVQVLRSLAEAHEAGIVHRDIKPGNVMVVQTRDGADWVKVVDFGIAKLGGPGLGAKGKRTTGVAEFVGTPNYVSPEQARGEALDARSDLYSLGAMLFELVSGRGPYEADTPMATVSRHLADPVPSLMERADVSEAFDLVVRKALAKRPEDRFQSADQMRAALEAVAGGPVRGQATPPPITGGLAIARREDWDAFERRLRRSQLARTWLGGLAIASALGGLGYAGYRQATAPKPAQPVLAEVEPNDEPALANLIALESKVQGAMGAAHKAGRSDEDTYLLQVPSQGSLWVSLSGVPDLNLVLEVFDADRRALGVEDPFTHAAADDGRLGEGELLGPYPVHAGRYYVRVSERPAYDEPDPHRPPRERAGAPYTLATHLVPPSPLDEAEPNDALTLAQKLTYAQPVLARAGAPVPAHVLERELALSALDYFAAPAPPTGSAWAFVVQPPDRAMGLWDGQEIGRWRAETRTFQARREELDKRLLASPGDKELRAEARRLAAPFLAAPTRAGSDGVAALKLVAREGQVALLAAPLSGPLPRLEDAPYGVAVAHPGPGGLEAVLALARELAAARRGGQARALVKAALAELPSAADAEQARALVGQLPE